MNKKTTYKNDLKKIPKKTRSFKKTKLKQYGGREFIATDFLPIKIVGIGNDCWLETSIQLLWCIDPLQQYFKEVTRQNIIAYKLNNANNPMEPIILDAINVLGTETEANLVFDHATRSDGVTSKYIDTIKNLILALKAIFEKYNESLTKEEHLVDLQEIMCPSINGEDTITVISSLKNCLSSLKMTLHEQHDPVEFIEHFLRGLTYFSECAELCETYTSISRFIGKPITYSSEYTRYDDLYRKIYLNKSTPLSKNEEWAASLLDNTLIQPDSDRTKFYNACMAAFNGLTLNTEVVSAVKFNVSVASYIHTLEPPLVLLEIETQAGLTDKLKTDIISIKDRVSLTDVDNGTHITAFNEITGLTKSINTSGPIKELQTIIIQLISYILKHDIDIHGNNYTEYLSHDHKLTDTTMIMILIGKLLAGFKVYRNNSLNDFNTFIENSQWFKTDFLEGQITPKTSGIIELIKLLFNAFDRYIVFSEIDIFKNLDYYYKNRDIFKTPYDIFLYPILNLAREDDKELTTNTIGKMIPKQKDLPYFNTNKLLILRINRTQAAVIKGISKVEITPDPTITVAKNTYKLRSCIVHSGSTSADGGHYRYTVYNDAGVAEIMLDGSTSRSISDADNKTILNQGYVYLYEKINSASAPPHIAHPPHTADASPPVSDQDRADTIKRQSDDLTRQSDDLTAGVDALKKLVDALKNATYDAEKVSLTSLDTVSARDNARNVVNALRTSADKVTADAVKVTADAVKVITAVAVLNAETRKLLGGAIGDRKLIAMDAENISKSAVENATTTSALAYNGVDNANHSVASATAIATALDAALAAADKTAVDKAAVDKAAADASDDASDDATKARTAGNREIARGSGSGESGSGESGRGESGSSDDKTSNKKKRSDDRDDPGDSSQDNTGENIVLGVLLCVTLVISTVMLL